LLHLKTFGDLTLTDDTGEIVRTPEKGLLLMAYLFTSPDFERRRDDIAGFLWSDTQPETASNNLRKLISRLRLIDRCPLEFTPTSIRLDIAAVTVDMDTTEPGLSKMELLKKLSSQLRHDFIGGTEQFSSAVRRWVASERSNQLSRLRDALLDALPLAKLSADFQAVKDATLQILDSDPNDNRVLATLEAISHEEVMEGFDGVRDTSADQLERLRAGVRLAVHARPKSPGVAETSLQMPTALPRIVLFPTSASDRLLPDAGLADALIEDVTIGLCALKAASIVAPHTAQQIRKEADKAAVARRHSISYLLDTRLSDQGLFAQLIYFPTDEIIWAERFSLQPGALLQNRQRIASDIGAVVASELRRNEISRQRFEASPEAYYSYLAGSNLMSSLTLPSVRRARKAFRLSLQHNPDFSPAFGAIARTYTNEWLLTARGDLDLLKQAERFAQDAIRADETLPVGHRELGVAQLYLGDFDASVEALAKAELLSPHYADVVYSYADTLVHAAKPQDGLTKIGKAIELNPLPPDTYWWTAAGASYFLGNYQDAVCYVERMHDSRPADRLVAASWAMMGDKRKARFYRQRVLQDNPSFNLERWLEIVPNKEGWQKELYREGLVKAGF
jgi:tetratricopeptide (TPR) repeat protein